MGIWIDLFVLCLSPIVIFGGFALVFHWLLDRIFGENTDGIAFPNQMMADFFRKTDFFAARKQRKMETNLHYDELVDAEWRALRLQDRYSENDFEETASLGQLLERKR